MNKFKDMPKENKIYALQRSFSFLPKAKYRSTDGGWFYEFFDLKSKISNFDWKVVSLLY